MRPWVFVWLGFEPAASCSAPGHLSSWAIQVVAFKLKDLTSYRTTFVQSNLCTMVSLGKWQLSWLLHIIGWPLYPGQLCRKYKAILKIFGMLSSERIILTWDQAQFSFRFVIIFRQARRNENRAWYKPSTKRLLPTFLIDWHLPHQPTKITSVACFSSMQIFHAWEKCRLADLKNSFYLLIFSVKNKTVSTITFNFLQDYCKGDLEGYFCWGRR